ncbi:MAG: hypothetical protein ACPHYF_06555 [Akkermansiaceae bacterium]
MRGIPPLQAFFLLIALSLLGYVGNQYIDMDLDNSNAPSSKDPEPAALTCAPTVEAEIEFVFSSPPLSCTITQPSETGGENKQLLALSMPQDNPCYDTAELVTHGLTTYWLDVVWPEDAADGSRHFVQIYISPDHGESQRFSFYSKTRTMNETFEYHTGDHHHE